MASKIVLKKVVVKGLIPLIIEAYKDHLDKDKVTIDLVVLNPIKPKSSIHLALLTKSETIVQLIHLIGLGIHCSKPEVDLSIWFESKEPLVTSPLVKNEVFS